MSQARTLRGACSVLLLGAVSGCSALDSLDGLTSDGGQAGPPATADDSSTDHGTGDDAAPGADASPSDGSPGDDVTVLADAEPDVAPVDAHVADAPGDAPGETSAPGPITWVQVTYANPQGLSSSVGATYAKAQTAGDLNVVVVGWNDTTATVATVTDSAGNSYALAVGPTQNTVNLSQSIYYAPNVHAANAGKNTVTVTFGPSANLVDLRILEYSGLDPVSPLDVTATGTAHSGGTAATSAVTTTHARELLVGGGMSTDMFSGSFAPFTARATTTDGDMVEDRIVSATGSYTASAPLNSSCDWVMQLATFH
jgi:hypothetical protein